MRSSRHGSEFSVQQAVMAALVNKLLQAGREGRGVCKFGSEEVEGWQGSGEGLYKLGPAAHVSSRRYIRETDNDH